MDEVEDDKPPRVTNLEFDPTFVPLYHILRHREEGSQKNPRLNIKQLENHRENALIEKKYEEVPCKLPGAPKSTFLMVFSPDGKCVASTHGDHNIYITDLKTGKCLRTLKGHPRTPWCIAFHPSSNELIASGCLGGEVSIWDMKGGREVWHQPEKNQIASLAFHPQDNVLAIASDNQIHFWNWTLPSPFVSIRTSMGTEKVKYVKFDPLGYRLITGIANILTALPSRSSLLSHSQLPTQSSSNLSSAARDALLTLPLSQHLHEARPSTSSVAGPSHEGLRPSEDSNSSSSLDSSSSLSNGVSGSERNTRLSLLWRSRLTNDSDVDRTSSELDLEERTGEGHVLRTEFDVRPDRRVSRERLSRYNEQRARRRRIGGVVNPPPVRDIPQRPANVRRRRKPDGGRWMYFMGKFNPNNPRAQTSQTRPLPSRGGRGSAVVAGTSRPGPSTAGPSTVGPSVLHRRILEARRRLHAPANSAASPSRTRLVGRSFGVQLLSQHTENMQRICRSLSIPRAHSELLRHRDEISRLQQIRTMLFDIQRQIRSLRASVDQTMDELPPELAANPPAGGVSPQYLRDVLNQVRSRHRQRTELELSLMNLSSISERIESWGNVDFNLPSTTDTPSATQLATNRRDSGQEVNGAGPSSVEAPPTNPITRVDSPTRLRELNLAVRVRRNHRTALRRLHQFAPSPSGGSPGLTPPSSSGNTLETIESIEALASSYWDRRARTRASGLQIYRSVINPSPPSSLEATPVHVSTTDSEDSETEARRTARPLSTALSHRISTMVNERYAAREQNGQERSHSPIDGRVADRPLPVRHARNPFYRADSVTTGDNLFPPPTETADTRRRNINSYRNVLQQMASRLQSLMNQQSLGIQETYANINEPSTNGSSSRPSSTNGAPAASSGPADPRAPRPLFEQDAEHFLNWRSHITRQYFEPRGGVIYTNSQAPISTFRLQSWAFDGLELPDLTDQLSGLVVPKCKIHFDASIEISDNGSMLVALVPAMNETLKVGVFSLETATLGEPLYTVNVNQNAICVSLSPTMRHLVVGIASAHTRWGPYPSDKQVVAGIYKLMGPRIRPMSMLSDLDEDEEMQELRPLQFLRSIELQADMRNVSLNSIKWLPYPGEGFIYGTNRGQLTLLQ